jgi:hypothetical protein
MFTAEELLLPISPANPAGTDMAFSPDMDAIAQARKFDDPSLAQGEWVTELKEADWGFVLDRCARLLRDKTKDLRVAVWLVEAAAKRHQLRGLGEGFRLLTGLCEQYWDQGLYPELEGADHEQRIGNLSWILSRTPALVREMPLTEGRGTAWSTVDFEAARKRVSGPDADQPPRLADMPSTAWIPSTGWNRWRMRSSAPTARGLRRRARPFRRCCMRCRRPLGRARRRPRSMPRMWHLPPISPRRSPRLRRRKARSAPAPTPSPSCAPSPASSARPSRTARCRISPRRRRMRASRICIPGCAR